MIRDVYKNEDYFFEFLKSNNELFKKGEIKLADGLVATKMISIYKQHQFNKLLNMTVAHYSLGEEHVKVREQLINAINYTSKSWIQEVVLLNINDQLQRQYHFSYDEMLWMLSLSLLLDIDDTYFEKLIKIIDRDQVKDNLFEFIIRSKFPDRPEIESESYEDYSGIPKVFASLREALKITDKETAQRIIGKFITKEWYPNHREYGWYNSHKSKFDSYFGYWSFETAAVVKIMGLDDGSFRDCQYYPADLVHYSG
jgi:hypothetical protein